MTAQHITGDLTVANEYLQKGWSIKQLDVQVCSVNFPENYPKGLTDYGVEKVRAELYRTVRTMVLEIKNVERHILYEKPCKGYGYCSLCNFGWIVKKKV